MPEPKIFIMDSRGRGSAMVDALRAVSEDLGIGADIQFSGRKETRLPRDFDTYILHLSDLHIPDFYELTDSQPWSRFLGLCGGAGYVYAGLADRFDEINFSLGDDEYVDILKNAQANWKRKKEE